MSNLSAPLPLTNAFALFDLDTSFSVDNEQLDSAYIQLNKLYHPDLFAQASSREKLYATQHIAQINAAYEMLKDPLQRGYHLLTLRGLNYDPNQEITVQDPALLMEALEDREALEETSDPTEIKALIHATHTRLEATTALIESYFAHPDLNKALQNLYRLRYLTKFSQDSQQKLSTLAAS